MTYSKLYVSCLFATTLAFAQFPLDTSNPSESVNTSSQDTSAGSPEETLNQMFQPLPPPPPPPSPKPEPAKQAPSGEKSAFDKLRGHAYNPYSTEGAATSIVDLLLIPSDIHGQKFFYVSPSDYLGYTAFDMFGGSAMLGLDNSSLDSPAALVLGYANSSFGMVLHYSISKSWITNEQNSNYKQSGRVTDAGDEIGLSFSIPLGGMTAYANASWLTYAESYSVEMKGSAVPNVYVESEDYSSLHATAGLTGASGSLKYNASANVIRSGGTLTTSDGNKAVDYGSFLGTFLSLNLGYAALESSDARVIVGLNNVVGAIFLDDVPNIRESDNQIQAMLSPNILGEVVLFENWLGFAGATHDLNLIAGDGDGDDDTSLLAIMHSNGTAAFAGVRYHRNSWALEAQVSTNPFEALNGSNIFANFGGFIYF